MSYTSAWRSPSNIALIKYWGKYGIQLPRNPSLSFTLSTCFTQMQLEVTPSSSPELVISYEGQPRPGFEPKIKSFFSLIESYFPWIKESVIKIDSHNTFPHGAGIASSASAMSAMALCLMSINDLISGSSSTMNPEWLQRASEISRLGSGSACRSVFPGAALWGKTESVPESNDNYALPLKNKMSPIFQDFQDTILIVSASEKAVSSTAGHSLMNTLAYADVRYAEARNNLTVILNAMESDDQLDTFISIVEQEALQLHALMMSGNTPFILMEPGTIAIIKEVWRYRKESNLPVCFTLDAGPNVHLLYPAFYKKQIVSWIKSNLLSYCAEGKYILDQVGSGPEKIS